MQFSSADEKVPLRTKGDERGADEESATDESAGSISLLALQEPHLHESQLLGPAIQMEAAVNSPGTA